MRSTVKKGAVLALWLSAQASVALAEQPSTSTEPVAPIEQTLPTLKAPDQRVSIRHFGVYTHNPLGMEYQVQPGVHRLLSRSEELLLKDTYVFGGALIRVNPVYSAVGPVVEWQPLAVFNLRARAEVLGFYGALGFMQSWPSPYDDSSDTARAARAQAGDFYPTWGWHAAVQPTLQAAVGPIAVQNRFSLEYWDMRLRAGDRIWYDAGPDHALPGQGFTLQDEVSVVYLGQPFVVGATLRYAKPLLTQAHFRPGEDAGLDASNLRLGALAAYTFFDGGLTGFNKPSVFVLAQWWLRHPYRTGRDVPGGVPFLAVGFTFQQDYPF